MALKPDISRYKSCFLHPRALSITSLTAWRALLTLGPGSWHHTVCPQHCCVPGGPRDPQTALLDQKLSWGGGCSDCTAQQHSQENWRSHGSTGDPTGGRVPVRQAGWWLMSPIHIPGSWDSSLT